MSVNIDCFLTFSKTKDQTHSTCGLILVHDKEEVFTKFTTQEDGLYLDGMLKLLGDAMTWCHERNVSGINLHIKIHHRNTNFWKVMQKIEKGYQLVKGKDDLKSVNFILSELFTRANYVKPKSYDMMVKLVYALRKANEKNQLDLFMNRESGNSYKSMSVFLEARGRQKAYGEAQESNIIQFPGPNANS